MRHYKLTKNVFDVTEFDPLNLSSAELYVLSAMGPQKVNEIVTTADVHAEKPVCDFNSTNFIRGKRRLETDTQKGSVKKKLKPTCTSDIDKISRLSESALCNPLVVVLILNTNQIKVVVNLVKSSSRINGINE